MRMAPVGPDAQMLGDQLPRCNFVGAGVSLAKGFEVSKPTSGPQDVKLSAMLPAMMTID